MNLPDPVVLIFDIDGTVGNYRTGSRALFRALLRYAASLGNPLHRCQFSDYLEKMRQIPKAGRTDRAILADVFQQFEIASQWHGQVQADFIHENVRLIRRSVASACGKIQELLQAIQQHERLVPVLLTGNFEEIARTKLERISIHNYFSLGSFGEISPERNDLFPPLLDTLRQRYPNLRPEETIIIGDTPNDISLARRFSCRVLAVACGMHSREELARLQPDHLIDSWTGLSDLLPLLPELSQNSYLAREGVRSPLNRPAGKTGL